MKTSTFEIPLDNGDGGLACSIEPELQSLGLRIVGQSTHPKSGAPMLIVQHQSRDEIHADRMMRKLLSTYDVRRIAA